MFTGRGLSLNQGTLYTSVQMIVEDGKKSKIQAVYIKGLFRIIQSISSKTVHFKLWLARVRDERLQEIESQRLPRVYERTL